MVEPTIKIGFVIVLLCLMIGAGTLVFPLFERYPIDYPVESLRNQPWRYIDSFYFSAMTLTTIGYGDIHPITDYGKIFTVFYSIFGVAIALYGLSIIAKWYITRSQQFEEHEIERVRQLLYKTHLNDTSVNTVGLKGSSQNKKQI